MIKILKLMMKGICAMLPMILISIYAWKNPLGFMDQEAPYYLWNKEKTNTAQDKQYGTLILGDSTANAAYVPEILSDDTINLALGGTTPVENYYVLQEWLENNPAPKACYISFVDQHFQMDECFWIRTMYSHRFSLRKNFDILKAAVHYAEPSIISEDYLADFISYELYFPNKYITSLMNAGFNQRYEENVTAQQLDELHGGRFIARGTSEYHPANEIVFNEFYVNPLFDDYYRRMIRLCMENDIQVHIVKLPLPDNKVFTQEYISAFYAYYEGLKESYPGLTVDWFSAYKNDYFADENHMNSHGALQFSNELKERYPNDFDDSYLSSEQVAGINDSIANENKVQQIIKWALGKDYTIVIDDAAGKFASVYEEILEENSIVLHQFDTSQLEDDSVIYYLSGINNGDARFSIQNTEGGSMIELENHQVQLWEKPEFAELNLAVIDHYNNSIICVKSFEYMDEIFQLACK